MSEGKRRVYMATFCLCGGALFVDRVVLPDGTTGPAVAKAAQGDPKRVDTAASTDLSLPHIAFPKVNAKDEEVLQRDFFARTPSGGQDDTGLSSKRDKADKSSIRNARLGHAAFETQFKLEGVLLGTRVAAATVDGENLQIGESIAGCKLVNVFGRTATFACFDGPAVLIIATKGEHKGS